MKQQAGALLSSIRIERGSDRKISVQLYMALREIILTGGLGAGRRLPASRTLAKEIGVSRTTVIDAIDRLVSEGMLVSRVGAGTYVSDVLAQPLTGADRPDAPQDVLAEPILSQRFSVALDNFAPRQRLPHKSQAFITALPALEAFPMAHWARISARHLRGNRDEIMGYGPPQGLDRLRRSIASHLNAARGIKCRPEQIFITGGAQQAFSILGRVLLNSGDRVWYENPGAIGAGNALVANGAQLVPVPVDGDGLDVEQGLQFAPDFRLAFVTPSHQQPLGHVMSLQRRLALLDAARAANAMIVEDDYDGEFHFSERVQPALKSIDTQDRVIYVGTFSKTLFPSIRLGFILSPDSLVPVFDRVFTSWISGPSTATQAVVSDFMDEGQFATHIRMMRRLYKARYDVLMQAAQALPPSIKIQPTRSGFHTTAYLDPRVDTARLVAQAAERNVITAPLSRYCLAPVEQNALVLGFGSAKPDDIQSGLKLLSGLPALDI
ncbi:PLP-dependent aminotransferase family protein [Neptunicoccus cionae]|uniref:MocR-like pyridoxine biosynthesis transcription factor PdxR n=1 Tax=Neptunicoccus cionae TaxID=2035344 RepID=UPI000C77C244|nr:PLP-dependent aminotransferase family protein [Amylibacter cionae]PLS20845.1 PLP-dependent aminotransferase family protein [Amylibacter cionae]